GCLRQQLARTCILGKPIELDQPQDAAHHQFQDIGKEPSHEGDDYQDNQPWQKAGETPGKLMRCLSQFADNHFPHDGLTFWRSRFPADTASVARTPSTDSRSNLPPRMWSCIGSP